ncbi:divalent metal cation transporter [Patescibacteria group bacterium]|nr:divalent metal cation transporter [Patescibacteria group bacterium]
MKKIKKFLRILGPGFITGASDDDPSGIATYSQTGAIFGFSQAWLALFSLPFMIVMQEISGRIGLVTGKGLAAVLRNYYPKKVLYLVVSLLFLANTINIGADLGAMAQASQGIIHAPFVVLLLIMVFATLFLEVFVSYKTYAKYLTYLCFVLLSYVASVFFISLNLRQVVSSIFVPHIIFERTYILNIVAVLGTTISPYLFFWQASEEVEEEVSHHKLLRMGYGRPKVTAKDILRLKTDTVIGMFFSNLVMWFIIIATGATIFTHGGRPIETAYDAALALRPFAGDLSFLLFAVGIIGTGLLAVPILAGSASYAVSEAFGWQEGLYRKLRSAHGFYAVIIIATLVGILINFLGIGPIVALYYTAVINGIIAPPLMVVLLLISNNRKIMGEKRNTLITNAIGVAAAVIMSISVVILLMSFLIK